MNCAFWLELTQNYRNYFWTCEWIFCWNMQCLTIYIGDRYCFRYGHVRFDTNINPQIPVFDINREPVPAPTVRTWFLLIARKPKVHSKNLKLLKTFKKCNHPDYKFYLHKLNNKIRPSPPPPPPPIWCVNINFVSVKIWRVTFLESFLPLKILNFGMVFGFRAIDDLPRAHWDETEYSAFECHFSHNINVPSLVWWLK